MILTKDIEPEIYKLVSENFWSLIEGEKMICSICEREGEETYFEKHHLIPQSNSDTINVCRQCGDQLHLMFDNGTLKRELNDIEKILSNELMKKYISWVKKKPIESHFSVAKKKRKI